MQIRFLHISDIHCGYENYDVDQLRKKLAPQLLNFTQEKGQKIDYLFITGDLKYGRACTEGYPPETLRFIRDIQSTFGIKPEQTFVVPGNHDVKRGDMRTSAIDGIKKSYQSHVGSISADHQLMLDMTQQEYRTLYQEICRTSCRDNHFFVNLGPVNVIHLNTALICGSDNEDGSLIVGMSMIRDALRGMDISKPAIVLAHHSFDCLTQEEQMKLERLLKEHNVLIYLCGHKHVNLFRNVASEVKDKPLWEILCGTNMDQAPGIEQTEMSVYVGTLDTEGRCGYIDAYKWSRRNEAWMPDSEFSHRECGSLDGRFYFPNRETNLSADASERYLNYLRRTYTDIQLDGLPADGHVGSRRFPLDSLYVPARFRCRIAVTKDFASDIPIDLTEKSTEPCSGPFNSKNYSVVLAGPGSGKTTYMKKVITDHVSGSCADGLYPILIRCRSLNERSDLSIMGILQDLPSTAEFPVDMSLRQAFCDIVCAKLRLGGILLLIDGLDEISDGRKRSLFIDQLDAFCKAYPQNRILITSRFAGYDDYTKSGLSEFEVLEIADFSDDDIRALCVNWHRTVVSDTEETTAKALELAKTIIGHERIKSLAKNPLLLTTLLLVQRRVGRLPTKRAALYDEAIKVLLETWNQEGHAPMDLDISTCKLAYIAYRMSCRRIVQITRKELLEYLDDARSDLSRKLGYDSMTPEEFLKRTEQRSSILIRVGFKTDDAGRLHEIYEFQHLTFQEYLTAVAVKEKYYPGAGRRDRAIDILKNPDGLNAFDEESEQKEVVLLTAAIIGWDAEDIALHLTDHLRSEHHTWFFSNIGIDLILDEIELERDTVADLITAICNKNIVNYAKLYQTGHRELAADIVLRKYAGPDLLARAPWWRMSFDNCSSLAGNFVHFSITLDELTISILYKFNILPQQPAITDGLLLVLSTFYRGFINAMEKRDTPYVQELRSRLEEYHAQHPEIPDLTRD